MGFKHLKRYGQHFLNDSDISEEIAQHLKEAYQSHHKILEIGPGEGVLTSYFHTEEWRENYYLSEIDGRLIDNLKENFPLLSENLIVGDVLKIDLKETFTNGLILFGNYPYNISSQIIFKMLDERDTVDILIGMFQKEVGMRICSGHGTKVYGILSVLVNAYYDSEYLMEIDENAFTPPPKVKSAVISLKRHPDKFQIKSDKLFKSLVKNTFGLRRKKISNSAKSFSFQQSDFVSACMDRRPEQMSVEDFVNLSNEIVT